MATLKLTCMVAMLCMVVLTAPMAEAAIPCDEVTSTLAPCLQYVTTGGPGPSPACCAGVKKLYTAAAAQTTPDRQAVCNCLKTIATSIRGLNMANAAAVPGKCGVNLPFKISMSTNCATIKY